MFDQDIQLHLSTNGHYAVEILPKNEVNSNECETVLMFDINTSQQSKIKCMDKIHKQFGHASAENLKRLFKIAGKLNSEITSLVDVAVKKRKTCRVYKKPNPRPIVGLSTATDFNHTVAMDLHPLSNNIWYFYMIDEFTRLSNAVIIKSKATTVVIKKFIQRWISLFGSPNRVFSYNGGEFESSEFKDM